MRIHLSPFLFLFLSLSRCLALLQVSLMHLLFMPTFSLTGKRRPHMTGRCLRFTAHTHSTHTGMHTHSHPPTPFHNTHTPPQTHSHVAISSPCLSSAATNLQSQRNCQRCRRRREGQRGKRKREMARGRAKGRESVGERE